MADASIRVEYKDLRKIPYLLVLVINGVNDMEPKQINITRMAGGQLGTTPPESIQDAEEAGEGWHNSEAARGG